MFQAGESVFPTVESMLSQYFGKVTENEGQC